MTSKGIHIQDDVEAKNHCQCHPHEAPEPQSGSESIPVPADLRALQIASPWETTLKHEIFLPASCPSPIVL